MSRSHTDVSEEVTDAACPLVEVIDHVAGKWSISILVAAARGPIRFTELERAVEGISRRMLTLNLRRLERDGLLTRTVHPTVPPKVEYSLTPMARELYAYLTGLVEWAERHRGAIARARTSYDAAAAATQADRHPRFST
ncbi:winged helix-turn-helix transcriptional regulator [Streptomyces sp. NPDC048202]|uniref:winged helix-turn-helix transcriptional regulator n=1 Tax=Streptomyces sp. NPDC048202 TaxID=3365514 RepID=UPI0037165664